MWGVTQVVRRVGLPSSSSTKPARIYAITNQYASFFGKAAKMKKMQEKQKKELEKNDIALAAVGTGAGKVLKGLTLTDPDAEIRNEAISFISEMIRFGSEFGAPASIGSMQGNVLIQSSTSDFSSLGELYVSLELDRSVTLY